MEVQSRRDWLGQRCPSFITLPAQLCAIRDPPTTSLLTQGTLGTLSRHQLPCPEQVARFGVRCGRVNHYLPHCSHCHIKHSFCSSLFWEKSGWGCISGNEHAAAVGLWLTRVNVPWLPSMVTDISDTHNKSFSYSDALPHRWHLMSPWTFSNLSCRPWMLQEVEALSAAASLAFSSFSLATLSLCTG